MNKRKTKASVEHKTNVLVWGYIVVVCLVLVALGTKGLLKKELIEGTGLNLLGDFAAGFFAPLAFIGVFGAFYLQREQLLLAQHENRISEERYGKQILAEKETAQLNYAATQANYRAALYDKRKAAFDRITRFSSEFKGPVSAEQLEELKSTIFDARFVFPDELNDWLYSIVDKAEYIHMLDISIKNAEDMLKKNPILTETMHNEMVQNSTKATNLKKELLNSILSEALFSRFKPYMALPDSIKP
ncbi:hypothetical protein FHR76_002192 [Rhizobium sp. RAS22]|nr:hypothetical protein [Rhizobium sp. RAS22]